MYPAVLLIYFISAAVILLASLALIVHVSLPYNKTGRASVLYSFILVFLRGFCGLNTPGCINKENTRYRAMVNRGELHEQPFQSSKVAVWFAMGTSVLWVRFYLKMVTARALRHDSAQLPASAVAKYLVYIPARWRRSAHCWTECESGS